MEMTNRNLFLQYVARVIFSCHAVYKENPSLKNLSDVFDGWSKENTRVGSNQLNMVEQ
jgi:hypothetical protein